MRPLVFCACAFVLVSACAQHPSTTNPPKTYKLVAGSYDVGVCDALIQDGKREKELPVRFCFPKLTGKFPVIFFSHGFGASGEHYQELAKHWASYGYVVISPTHSDSFSLKKPPQDPFDLRILQNRRDNDARLAEERVADLKLLIDIFPALKGMMRDFRGDLDPDSIGVAGHSLGAHTAQLIAGAESSQGRRRSAQLADSRIKAALLLSAPGRGQMGLTERSWEKIQIPLLVMTGSQDFSGRGQGSVSRLDPFELSSQKQKYGVYIEGANHFSFVGNPEIARRIGAWTGVRRRNPEAVAPDQKDIFDWVKIACIAFWDASLKKSEKAQKYLDSEELPAFSQGKVKLTRR